MKALRFYIKRILRLISVQPEPVFTEAQYKAFFSSPVWLALRHMAACKMDRVADVLCDSKDLEAMYKAQGMVQGLSLVLTTEDILRDLIASTSTEEGKIAIEHSRETERKLKQLFQMMETELEEEENA